MFPPFQINLVSDDYQLLMSILSKNMTEGADELPPPPKPLPRKTPSGKPINIKLNTFTASFILCNTLFDIFRKCYSLIWI